jgi:hypothetical protein
MRDRTASRLASSLPFPHDDPIAVLGWPETTGAALAERPDLDVAVIRTDSTARRLRARSGDDALRPRVVDMTEVLVAPPSHLLVEVYAASPTTAMVPNGTGDLVWSLGTVELWLVAGVGRLIPQRLFEVARDEIERTDEPVAETLELGRARRIAGPGGLDAPDRFAARLDCPVAPELLRL